MRLKRIELIIIGVTLAFACFMGGFFTGRNRSDINIVSASSQNNELQVYSSANQPHSETPQENPQPQHPRDSTSTGAEQPSGININTENPQENTQENTGFPRAGDGKININTATQSELTDLPGIGNVLASRIVDYRRQYGHFSKIEDLRNVSGIGEKRYVAIEDKITVG